MNLGIAMSNSTTRSFPFRGVSGGVIGMEGTVFRKLSPSTSTFCEPGSDWGGEEGCMSSGDGIVPMRRDSLPLLIAGSLSSLLAAELSSLPAAGVPGRKLMGTTL
jgi:hypothetical protein